MGQDVFGPGERRASCLLVAHCGLGAPFKRCCQGGANAGTRTHDVLGVPGNFCGFAEV